MTRWAKRTIAYLLIAAFTVLSSGCGKSGHVNEDNFYCKMDEVDMEQLESMRLLNRGSQVLLYGKSMDEMTMQTVEKFAWLQEGAVANQFSVPISQDESMDLVTVSKEGEVYVVSYTNRVLNPKDDEDLAEVKEDTQNTENAQEEIKNTQKIERKVYRNSDDNPYSNTFVDDKRSIFGSISEHERLKRLREQNQPRPEGAIDFSDHSVRGTERNEIKEEGILHVADRFKPEKPVVEEPETETVEEETALDEEAFDGDMLGMGEDVGEDEQLMDEPGEFADDEMPMDEPGEFTEDGLPMDEMSEFPDGEMDMGDGVETQEDYSFYLIRYDQNGQQVFAKDLMTDQELGRALEGNVYFDSMVVDQENVYLSNGDGYTIFDTLGNFKEVVKYSKLSSKIQSYGTTLLYDNEGNIYLDFIQASGENCLASIDLAGKSLGNIYDTGETYFISIYPGGSQKFLINKAGAIMGYNCDDKGLVKVLDPMASDLSIGNLREVAAADADHFYGLYSDLEEGSNHLGYFTHVDSSNIPKKTNLTLVTVTMDSTVNRMISEFNSKNSDYRINLVNYSSLYGTSDYYPDENVIEKLNTDIVAGNVPDLLLVTEGVPLSTYIGKGLIQDINPLIEADESITEDDYYLSVMRKFGEDEKLYRLVPCFYVDSLVVKSSLLNGKTSWTIDDVNQIMEEQGCKKFLDFYTRPEILTLCMTQAGSQFVDYENSKCYFDTENFRKMMAFIKTFPTDYSYDGYDDTAIRTNKQLSERIYLSNFRTLNNFEQVDFGEEVTLVGFPSDNGSGSTLAAQLQICMSSKTKDKEACWEFMKMFLDDSFQESEEMGYLPMKKSAWKLARERSKEKPYWIDEAGNKNEYDDIYFMGGQEIIVEPATDEKLDRYENMILSVDRTNDVDPKVIEILTEELQGYFEDKVSAESASKRIQSRVQIYLYECE